MKMEPGKSILILGAGTMGRGIARLFIQKGYSVALFDKMRGAASKSKEQIQQELVRSAEKAQVLKIDAERMVDQISTPSKLTGLNPVLAIEAIVEDLNEKKTLLAEMESSLPKTCILATNTSSLSVSSLAAGLAAPGRFIGLHFFNPPVSMPLVEIAPGEGTSPSTVEWVRGELMQMGKTPILVKDSPGFIVNRVARPFYLESLRLVEHSLASIESIDRLCRSAGFRMGPFELMDLIGNDTNYAVTVSMYEAFHQEPRFRPSRLQRGKVESGALGHKTGHGYYPYPH